MNALIGPRVLDFVLANTPKPEFNPDTVTPGAWGFVAIFLVAVATVLLALDMARRIRRTTYRSQIQAKLEAEVAAREAGEDHRPE
ncbi:hypothetical protein [Cryobacterium tagatosivorans]|uniref:Uncharacterized protein n=1 Tax=Cryobacterium tagatosivorans TaxID=1259199 RepID=A0A4R8UDU7_9MICO|nr:hypothetical protein [Cryobacterium tagatosivorans]TFB50402.1 hypothetical protein E3O23_09680 [Cryobacterium tagatosivorans]